MSLAERVDGLPTGPGVYLFKSASGKVLYVGKAQNLRARVRQYVAGGDGRIRIPSLVRRAAYSSNMGCRPLMTGGAGKTPR